MTRRPGSPAASSVRVAGAQIRYTLHRAGPRDLVVVHGSGAHSGWWHAVVPLLTEDWRVIALDLSGHGDSLGGRVALLAAAMRPERFAELVLLDTGIWAPEALRERLAARRPGSAQVHATYAEARARFRLMPPQPQPASAVLDPVTEQGLRPVPGGWTWKHDPAGFPPLYGEDVQRAAATVSVPVTYASGELSPVVSAELAARAAAVLPHVTTVRIPGAHHHLPLEVPEACARLIDEAGNRVATR